MSTGLFIQTGNIILDESFDSAHLEYKSGEYIFFSISDNGIGMDEDIKNKIFEPFFSTKKKEEGTGLGLATVYGILKQNNATILVDSKPGKGSTFKVCWPCAEVEIKNTISNRSVICPYEKTCIQICSSTISNSKTSDYNAISSDYNISLFSYILTIDNCSVFIFSNKVYTFID